MPFSLSDVTLRARRTHRGEKALPQVPKVNGPEQMRTRKSNEEWSRCETKHKGSHPSVGSSAKNRNRSAITTSKLSQIRNLLPSTPTPHDPFHSFIPPLNVLDPLGSNRFLLFWF
ncbi:hypothetical protein TNCV_3357541 [Trichonephila clavipes]|nr:hypothetical protein TNCV_3357541 [Trichonephila clavipes]